jgi:putative tricarboxylic transport membrane protein
MSLIEAITTVFSYPTILFLTLGLLIGVILGAIPGIGGILGMAIALPLTAGIDGTSAIIGLIAIYIGAMYGGAVSAILFNIPGTNAAVTATLDGYPLAKEGRAMYALSISAFSSCIGGVLSAIILLFSFSYLAPLLQTVGTVQYFLIAVFGLAILPLVSKGSQLKSVFSAAIGLLATTIGLAPMSTDIRFSFGIDMLSDGLDFVAILIGLFAITEMAFLVGKKRDSIASDNDLTEFDIVTLKESVHFVISHPISTVKSALIGMFVGTIPGAGAAISTFVSYSEAVRSSGDPDSFGEGNEMGLLSSEAANNATANGSLIPTLAFGIPGSSSSAIILGGLILHGVVPGPQMFSSNPTLLQTIFFSTAVASVLVGFIGLFGISRLTYVIKIDKNIIVPIVVIFSFCGAFTLNLNPVDVLTVAAFGVVGYLFRKYNYPVISLLLGAILGGIIETNLYRSIQLGGISAFYQDPLSIVLIIAIVAVLITPHLRSIGMLSRLRKTG